MPDQHLTRRDFLAVVGSAVVVATAPNVVSCARATETEVSTVTTSDGVKLKYMLAGAGRPLVMIPGWSQTAAQLKYQIAGLGQNYRVIAVDMRGHGESEKVNHGYKISRLAKDVHDILHKLNLHDVTLLGHSMGCAVIWCYWDMYGPERISKLVLVDLAPFITENPKWSPDEKRDAGAVLDAAGLYDFYNQLTGPDAAKATEEFFADGMVTKAMPADEKSWIIQQNFKLPRRYAADLFYSLATQDWRDVIPRINIPTLVVGGKASFVPWTSQVWISQQIRGSRLEIFEENEGGAHFMFMEAPDKFNRIVSEFVG
ncbi:MAG TPA: alpha/beta hydrolase [Myxococcota bacterium]|nr:alpha/beta hydrolase [Myxococcota bacterium]